MITVQQSYKNTGPRSNAFGTCVRSQAINYPGLMWSPAVFLARTLVLQAAGMVWQGIDLGYGGRCGELFETTDPGRYCWKTCQLSLFGEAMRSQPVLPRWGMAYPGGLYQLQTPERHISGIAGFVSDCWPPPTAQDGANNAGPSQFQRNTLPLNARVWATPTAADCQGTTGGNMRQSLRTETKTNGQALNPDWVESLMGYPPGWTVIE